MFVEFFFELKRQKIPVTIREFLVFLESLEGDFINKSIHDFYILSRISLVKDEKYFDQFDQPEGSTLRDYRDLIVKQLFFRKKYRCPPKDYLYRRSRILFAPDTCVNNPIWLKAFYLLI